MHAAALGTLLFSAALASGPGATKPAGDPAKLVVTTSRPAPYTRRVAVYVPKAYVPGTAAPFIVGADGPDPLLFTALDHLIPQKRVPLLIGISIGTSVPTHERPTPGPAWLSDQNGCPSRRKLATA